MRFYSFLGSYFFQAILILLKHGKSYTKKGEKGIEIGSNNNIQTEPNPKVHIQYFGDIRAAAHKNGEEMEITPGIAAYEFLKRLADINGKAFRQEIFQRDGKLRDDLTVTVNKAIINHDAAANTYLEPGDVLSLFPVFPGGG